MLVGRLTKAELLEDAGHVPFDGGHRDHQFVCDADIGTALCDQRQDLPLARRQVIDRTCPALTAHQPREHGRDRAPTRRPRHGVRHRRTCPDRRLFPSGGSQHPAHRQPRGRMHSCPQGTGTGPGCLLRDGRHGSAVPPGARRRPDPGASGCRRRSRPGDTRGPSRTSSRASAAVPTTSNPPSWRTCTIPSRTKGWSSPTMTRICCGGPTLQSYARRLGQRYITRRYCADVGRHLSRRVHPRRNLVGRYRNPCVQRRAAAAGRTDDVHGSVEHPDPVVQASQAAPVGPWPSAANPVIVHLHRAPILLCCHSHQDVAGTRVLHNVGERLRAEEINARLDRARKPALG